MKLSELMKYPEIVIQCHDNPDPDTIGAGYGLYKFFESKGKKVRLIYSGALKMTKSNVVLLVNEFNIPLEYVEEIDIKGLLITVDAQYGSGNIKKFKADHIAIIDHHLSHIEDYEMTEMIEIRSFLSSACTLVWDLLRDEGFEVNDHIDVATCLYYGLFTDTGGFAEIGHPLDKDMMESLIVDHRVIRKLKNSVLTLSELEIAGMALIRHSYNEANKFVVVKAKECDPNILGFISDLALQVDSVYVCVVYNENSRGIKFSVRSCENEIMANELAVFLADGMGSGGGHIEKAGGFINRKSYNAIYSHLNADEYFLSRLTQYYKSFEVIYSTEACISTEDMCLYKKKPLPLGFVPLTDVVADQTPIMIRTLEGDIDLLASKDIYVMIGIKGEVYPITKENFEKDFTVLNKEYDIELEYFPSIRNKQDSNSIKLKPFARKCMAKEDSYIYARPLEKAVKVFTMWDAEKYMYGEIGDYLAVKADDCHDIFVVKKEVFPKTYDRESK